VTVSSTLLGAAAILVVSAIVGLVVNQQSSKPLPLFVKPQRPLPRGSEPISPAQAKAIFDAQDALFVDARSTTLYSDGHISGAINFPVSDFEEYYPRLFDTLRRARALVIYCDGPDCGETQKLAQLLGEKGFKDFYLFFEGWPGWREAGYPAAQGARPDGD